MKVFIVVFHPYGLFAPHKAFIDTIRIWDSLQQSKGLVRRLDTVEERRSVTQAGAKYFKLGCLPDGEWLSLLSARVVGQGPDLEGFQIVASLSAYTSPLVVYRVDETHTRFPWSAALHDACCVTQTAHTTRHEFADLRD